MSTVASIVGALIAIGVLVVVHEFGHFLAAKLFKVGVPVFSVGMGPRIFGFWWRGTDYRLSALPIGGYVQLEGADPFGEEDFEGPAAPLENNFMHKPVWQRLIVLFAGPAANIVLPVLIFTLLFMGGYPEYRPELGMVSYDSPAWHAGLRDGDVVLAVDDLKVRSWRDLERMLAKRAGSAVELSVERGGEALVVSLPEGVIERRAVNVISAESLGIEAGRRSARIGVAHPESPAAKAGLQTFDGITKVQGSKVDGWAGLIHALDPLDQAEIHYVRADLETGERSEGVVTLSRSQWSPDPEDPWSNPWGFAPADLYAGAVMEGRPADEAGVVPGDRLFAIDGVPVRDFLHLKSLIAVSAVDRIDRSAGTRPITLTLMREGQRLDRAFTPVLIDDTTVDGTRYTPIIGVTIVSDARLLPERVLRRYNPITALGLGVERTWEAAENVFTALGSLIRGRTNPAKMVGGPLAIFAVTGQSLMMGIHAYAGTVAAISVSLAIVNLLPVPALDGGQITVFLIEWIRGRPLSAELRVRIQMFGVLILFALIILVTISDIFNVFFPEV